MRTLPLCNRSASVCSSDFPGLPEATTGFVGFSPFPLTFSQLGNGATSIEQATIVAGHPYNFDVTGFINSLPVHNFVGGNNQGVPYISPLFTLRDPSVGQQEIIEPGAMTLSWRTH